MPKRYDGEHLMRARLSLAYKLLCLLNDPLVHQVDLGTRGKENSMEPHISFKVLYREIN
jgi:hypothetical protein